MLCLAYSLFNRHATIQRYPGSPSVIHFFKFSEGTCISAVLAEVSCDSEFSECKERGRTPLCSPAPSPGPLRIVHASSFRSRNSDELPISRQRASCGSEQTFEFPSLHIVKYGCFLSLHLKSSNSKGNVCCWGTNLHGEPLALKVIL